MMNSRVVFSRINQVLVDIAIFIASLYVAYFLRFEGLPSQAYFRQLTLLFPLAALVRLLSFFVFSVYSITWRYISILDVLSIFKACAPPSILFLLARRFLPERFSTFRVPFGVIAIEFLLVLLGTLSIRMAGRLINEYKERNRNGDRPSVIRKKTLLIGAGDAGNMVAKELIKRTDLGYQIVGFIDDDPKKLKTNIQGIKVRGTSRDIPHLAKKFDAAQAIITIANASSGEIQRIVDVCERAKIKVKIVPALYEILDDSIKITKIRDININDLLGRTLVNFDRQLPRMIEHYRGKRILVSGAGGSIGSELCRQLAVLEPGELILVDKDENSIYEVAFELTRERKSLPIRPAILNILQEERLASVFERYRPDIVLHAAAHKHVPLMEDNVPEAILNNVLGTQLIAETSDRIGVQNFIFISTDKAINPTSIMGSTKKVGEIIIQELASRSRTRFACVRFGNVLGSRGSVVPLFQKQIAYGGPITVTHPDIKRYFMSISEAVQLILQAGTIGKNGEIFVLDMGKQIKILKLARDLIKLSGHKETDIAIEYIGLRPGEKLYEEVLVDEEKALATQFEKIFIAPALEIDADKFFPRLARLVDAARKGDEDAIVGLLRDMDIGFVRGDIPLPTRETRSAQDRKDRT